MATPSFNSEQPFFSTKLGSLFCADCVEWLKTIGTETADLVFADPPYNIKKAEWDSFESQEKYAEWSLEWINQAHRILKPTGTLYICGFPEILADIKWVAGGLFAGCKWLVWYYRNKANMGNDWGRSHEALLHLRKARRFTFNIDSVRVPYNQHTLKYPDHPQAETSQYGNGKEHTWKPNPLGAKPRDVLEIPTICNTTKEKTLHPTQKPVELLRRILFASTVENDVIVDPFGGSGTTYAVCELYNRRWLGCEISEEYCRVIVDRIRHPEKYSGERNHLADDALIMRRQRLRYGV